MKPIFDALIRWYDNGIYYPDRFLWTIIAIVTGVTWGVVALFALLYPSALRTSLQLFHRLRVSVRKGIGAVIHQQKSKRIRVLTLVAALQILGEGIRDQYFAKRIWFLRNQTIVLVVLLAVTVFTRIYVSYWGEVVAAPEQVFQLIPVGRDLFSGVYGPGLMLVSKNGFYGPFTAVGSGILLLAGPYIKNYLFARGYCYYVNLGCHYVFYKGFLTLSFVSWLLFLFMILRRVPKDTKLIMLLLFLTFLLGIPGSIGIERGNIDILLSAIVGFLLLLLLRLSRDRKQMSGYISISLLIGFAAGFLTNAKLFLFPFALIAMIVSPSPVVSAAMAALTFYGLTEYLPQALYDVTTTINDLYLANVMGLKESIRLFFLPERLALNHSFEATATLFTRCGRSGTCAEVAVSRFATLLLSRIPLTFLFVFPTLPLWVSIIKTANMRPYKIMRFLTRLRNDRRVILLFFIIADAGINLVPQVSFVYRLYYSLPILLILFKEVQRDFKARWFCVLSMISLVLKGFWINYMIQPKEMILFDARMMNVFVILHFYFMIKAGAVALERR